MAARTAFRAELKTTSASSPRSSISDQKRLDARVLLRHRIILRPFGCQINSFLTASASTDEAIRRGSGCGLHQKLVECLKPRDTVISFNYDCVMVRGSRSLRRTRRGTPLEADSSSPVGVGAQSQTNSAQRA